jgi:flagellar basal-body rod protein FlgG
MAGLAEIASAMMSQAQRALEMTARNVSNAATPGYRSERAFAAIVDERSGLPRLDVARRAGEGGALKPTGSALDLAAEGGGMLVLRSGDSYFLVRSAQLRWTASGTLVDASGSALQAAAGGDVTVSSGTPVILPDGTILANGQPEARIALVAGSPQQRGEMVLDAAGLSLLEEGEGAVVRQGMVTPSDVDLAEEMVELTRLGRFAETGARVFQVTDELMGRATSKLVEMGA